MRLPLALLTTLLLLTVPAVRATPSVSNHVPGSEVRYPVVLLRGAVAEGANGIALENASSGRDTNRMEGLVAEGRFKILAELVPGENSLSICDGVGEPVEMVLNYAPETIPYYVRVVWMTDRDGDTTYPSSLENDPQNYAEKLDTMANLLQTFTAERMLVSVNDIALV